MANRKTKKSRVKRASRTHGYGQSKKHRGAGHRGGKGFAGIGKRGGQKKSRYLALGIQPYGKKGMRLSRRDKKEPVAISIKDLIQRLDSWLVEKKIEKQGDTFVVDLKKLKFTKLLAQGKVTKKLKITVDAFSAKAKEKIEAAGGRVDQTELAEGSPAPAAKTSE